MALNWQSPIIPSGMIYNSGDTSFLNQLFNFLLPLESPVFDVTLVAGNPTIGLGFDLVAGGAPVQNAVLDALGFSTNDVALTTAPPLGASVQELDEFSYIDKIRQAIAMRSPAGDAQLDQIMAQRFNQYNSDPAFRAYVDEHVQNGVEQRGAFTFYSYDEVFSVFSTLWTNVYQVELFNKYRFLRQDPTFAGSREELALASMLWNGGPGLLGSQLVACTN